MKVYVKSQSGKWLMPTNSANARILLKQGKAKVIQRTPFALQLVYETTEYIQPVTVGIEGLIPLFNNGALWDFLLSKNGKRKL